MHDHREDLSALGVAVVRISLDEPEQQRRFEGTYGLGFALLSDADHTVAEA